jgi:hypothetical protein
LVTQVREAATQMSQRLNHLPERADGLPLSKKKAA